MSSPAQRSQWSPRVWYALSFVLLAASVVFPLLAMRNNDRGDTPYYFGWAGRMLNGQVPYRDFTVEYPPYALFWFLLPAPFRKEPDYLLAFALEVLAIDLVLKALLLREGRQLPRWLSFVPFLVVAADGFIQDSLYLKRFDLVPATMVFVAVLLLSRGAMLASGILLTCATMTKLYPVLLIPIAVVRASRKEQLPRLITGLLLGLIPLAVMSLFMPWWKFFTYHQERGLQVESLAASFLWLAHVLRDVPASWGFGHGAYEVGGTVAARVLPLAQGVWAITVLLSVVIAVRRVREGFDDLGRVSLLPILAFVAFNYVLSPQYMIWLMSLVALAFARGWSWPLMAICLALCLTQLIFGNDYWSGLKLPMTAVLCTRNTLLALAWLGLARELLQPGKGLATAPAPA